MDDKRIVVDEIHDEMARFLISEISDGSNEYPINMPVEWMATLLGVEEDQIHEGSVYVHINGQTRDVTDWSRVKAKALYQKLVDREGQR